jgi:5-hydroxyisourate hydrolase
MSAITTHVLDLSLGRPAAGVPVRLEVLQSDSGWVSLAEKATDDDGRVKDLMDVGARLDTGTYRLTVLTGNYFERQDKPSFYPEVTVVFRVTEVGGHYHVPLLLSPFGYSTYRGS